MVLSRLLPSGNTSSQASCKSGSATIAIPSASEKPRAMAIFCHLGARDDANGVWKCGGFRSSHRDANEHHVARATRGLDIDLDADAAFRMPKL
jgi:hypothetical protein